MAMESRSTKISNVASVHLQANRPALITIKRGVKYYENWEEENGPFFAVTPDGALWETTFYGLQDVELFG